MVNNCALALLLVPALGVYRPPPACYVDSQGRTVVQYTDGVDTTFRCHHHAANEQGETCTCTKKHPTHHGTNCREFQSSVKINGVAVHDRYVHMSGKCEGVGITPVKNCETQEGPLCIRCKDTFERVNNECVPLPIPHCLKQNDIMCVQCERFYTRHGLRSCAPTRIPQCKVQDKTTCATCLEGFALANNKCVLAAELANMKSIDGKELWERWSHKGPSHCSGGRVWHECGSACTPTCEEPSPICTKQCVPRCACPAAAPLLHHGACVQQASCKTP